MKKRLITACLLPIFIALTAAGQTPKPYENWPATDQEWNTLTNHIMWCYNSLQDRWCAATGRTNDIQHPFIEWEPSLVCPFRDYSLIAREIDRLVPYFVNHKLAGVNDDFKDYFAPTNSTGTLPTEFPLWTPESLHSNAFELADWSTNSVLTVWMAVTNRAFIAEVTKALHLLKWTSFKGPPDCLDYERPESGSELHAQVRTNAPFVTALAELRTRYSNSKVNYGVRNYVKAFNGDYSGWVDLEMECKYCYGTAFTNQVPTSIFDRKLFAYSPNVSVYVRRDIDIDNYVPSATVIGRRKVFLAENFGKLNTESLPFTTNNPIADIYSEPNFDPMSYAELSGASYGDDDAWYQEYDLPPLWLMKWGFEDFPEDKLPSAAPVETADVDMDGIVETMPVAGLPGAETGTFVLSPADESPIFYLPIASETAWNSLLPVHAYISQGAVTNLPYHCWPWVGRGLVSSWEEAEGEDVMPALYGTDFPLLGLNAFHYSLNTCVLEQQEIINDQTHVKQVVILRPRGEVVIFEFPWEETGFSIKGYPTGINRNLGYVLYDDFDFTLMFPSGVSHYFEPLEDFCSWRSAPLKHVSKGAMYSPWQGSFWFGLSTQEVVCVTGRVYRTTVEWEKGVPTQANYNSLKTGEPCESVSLGYSGGRAVRLDKSDLEAGAKIQVDNSVLYGTGVKRVRQQTGTREAGRVVTVTTFASEGATTPYLTETTTYDNRQRLTNWTLSAGGQSVSSGYTYKEESATDERYPKTGLLVRNSVEAHTRAGSYGSVTETYTYTTQQGWPSLVSASLGGGCTSQRAFEYYPENPYGFIVPDRILRLKSTEQKQDGVSYSKMFSDMTSSFFYTKICNDPDAEYDDASNQLFVKSWNTAGDDGKTYRLYYNYFRSPSSTVNIFNYSNTLTEVGFRTEKEATTNYLIMNARGVPLYSKTVTFEGAKLEETVTQVDGRGRPTKTQFMDGTSVSYTNYCVHGPQKIINRDLSFTTLQYTPFGYVKKRVDGETGITYEYEYDPNGNVTKQTRSSGTLTAESFATYGLDGALLYSKDEHGHEVTITGQSNNGFLVLTRVETGKSAVISTYWADGTLKSVTGDGADAKFDRVRGVTDNKYWIKTVNPENANEWSTQWHQYNGLFAYTEQPDAKTNSIAYDEKLRPKSGLSADSVKSLASYDAKYPWLPSVSGVSLGATALDLSSDPYCVSNSYAFTAQGLTTEQYSFPEDSSATPFKESSMQVSPDGRTGTFSVQGRIGTFSCDAAPSTGTYTKTVNLPGGGVATYTYSKFLLRKETTRGAGLAPAVTKTYEYDSFNRLEKFTTDERGFKETVKVNRDPAKGIVSSINSSSRGTTTLTRENDLLKQIATPSGTTKFDWLGNGSLKSVQQDLGPTFSRTEDAFGRGSTVTRQNEGQTSVLGFTYGNDGGFAGKTRGGVQKISVTSRRADGRPKVLVLPDNITVTTTYDGAGSPSGETWTDPVNSSATVAFTYSWMRDGSLRSHAQTGGPHVSNSVTRTGERIASDTSTFGCGTYGASVQTFYDATHGAPSLVAAQFNGFTNMNLSAAAGYDSLGYLSALAGTGFTNVIYCAAGGLVTNTLAAVGGIRLSRSVIWSAQAGKPARVEYTLGGQFLRRWQYAFTNGLIASVSRSGGDGYRTAYTYDGARQLLGATSSTTNGTALAGLSFAYEYNLAGDTLRYGRAGMQNTAHQTSDDLQTFRIWGPYVHLLGRVSALNASVAASTSYSTNPVPASVINGLYYAAPLAGLYLATAEFGTATVTATPPGGTSDTARVSFSLPATFEEPAYNNRGMILADSRRQYTWDAAERLLAVSNSGVSNAVRLAFQYYPDGRRALKTVSCFTNNAWVVTRSLQYAWQGWKLAAECERDGAGTITAVRHFVWGPDIAGQQTASLDSGAEGVGGLLLIREWKPGRGMKQYLPLTDGLGSICGLIDATDGSLVAEYDYDPYGGPVIERGVAADACPFRHRTRYYDAETWLYYYGYRYYDPSTTKWISKDPLGEEGGWNLTCFCDNDPVNGYDPTGLSTFMPPGAREGEYISFHDHAVMLQGASDLILDGAADTCEATQYPSPSQGMGVFLDGRPSRIQREAARSTIDSLYRVTEQISGCPRDSKEIQEAKTAWIILGTSSAFINWGANLNWRSLKLTKKKTGAGLLDEILPKPLEPATGPGVNLQQSTAGAGGIAKTPMGARHISSDAGYLDDLLKTGQIPANTRGSYFTLEEGYDVLTPFRLQVPHDGAIRIEFTLSQLGDDIAVPLGNYGRGPHLEPFARDFPDFGFGGASQRITTSPIQAERIIDTRTGKILFQRKN